MDTYKTAGWFKFQEDIKEHFLSLGADAETNVSVQGARTIHDVDVLVRTRFLGENLQWIVEAKHWKTKITKLHVLALRTIADDVGADRAFIVSTSGFQKGAYEAADNTNVTLKTFKELREHTRELVESEILESYKQRLRLTEKRCLAHSKSRRIKYGLRHERVFGSGEFSAAEILMKAHTAIVLAENRQYPIDLEMYLTDRKGESVAYSFQQLINWLNLNLNHFDERLLKAEWDMAKNGDYIPSGKITQSEYVLFGDALAEALRLLFSNSHDGTYMDRT
ncbi:restriction endonuclease [Rhodopirellula bahusiensis]|uniref:Restriction endonuclease n=1 Tax=Rhodopirellula bahusiensis TaxID=2014065 RepID=A0A2G1VYZ0_9BACT|nr:restriction endonuclease [Rhodopirellula bahusiensis]PHQ31987.1 restriction endonuclease [Rhodopirellula bahusiensis]